MADSNSSNHWDVLASTLGAKPSPDEASDRQQPQPATAPPVVPHKPAPRHERATPARQPNWDALASDFGLPPATTEASQSAPPSPPEVNRPASPPPDAPEDSPNFFDERFDFEEPFDILESSEASIAPTEQTEGTSESTEERPRKRRRRRRGRGRGSERRDTRAGDGGANADRPSDTAQATTEESDQEPLLATSESTGAEPADSETAADESEQRRPKRRRSRRGRGRKVKDSSDTATPEKSEDRPSSRTAKSQDAAADEDDALAEDVMADDALELDEVAEGGEERPARLGFRGIPAWDEVVGLLVEKNLEARSKRPAGGPHHGRGNRGSRDSRGGRGGKRR